MSFFKELKDDIAQSVNELGEAVEGTQSSDVEAVETNTVAEDIGLPDIQPLEEPEESKMVDELMEEEQAAEDWNSDAEALADVEKMELEPEAEPEEVIEEPEEEMIEELPSYNEPEEDGFHGGSGGEETIITQGTTINGGIQSDTSLVIKGIINGDVDCKGKLTITGKVAGNINASEVYVNTSRLEGELVSDGSVKIDVGTVVIGGISSSSLVVAGAIKGNVTVDGPVIVDSTAVVQGDISAKSLQVNSGAIIDGKCSLVQKEVDLSTFFE